MKDINKISIFNKTLLISAILLELGLVSTQAATINVDGTTCNLTDAITSANTDAAIGGCITGNGDDTLNLSSNGTFTLNSQLPNITSNTTINCNDSSISRNPAAGTNFRILTIYSSTVEVNNCIISNGIDSENYSGGIYINGGSLSINDSTISNNTQGAILFENTTNSAINNSTISNNTASNDAYYGGGINIASSEVTISNSTISHNSSLSTRTYAGGGGIYIQNLLSDASVLIENSTIFSNNSSYRGGAISHRDYYGSSTSLIIKNTTISGNSSSQMGGALAFDSINAELVNTTITNNSSANSGGALFLNDNGAVTITQSILTGNSAITTGNEINLVSGTITVNNRNIFGFNNNSGISGFTIGVTDIIPTVALASILDTTLALNGGTTKTHALVAGSPAIDAVLSTNCITTNDQRGVTRPQDGDNNTIADCDIGALEHVFITDLIFKNGFE